MQKQKRITLNADKRKVIADVFQDHFELSGTTEYIGWPKVSAHGPGPIKLQDHSDKSGVSYRNVWVRPLD